MILIYMRDYAYLDDHKNKGEQNILVRYIYYSVLYVPQIVYQKTNFLWDLSKHVRGLNTKTLSLIPKISICNFKVIVFTKIWLSNNITNSELNFHNYIIIYRCDRSSLASNLCRGGGVLIVIKKYLNSQLSTQYWYSVYRRVIHSCKNWKY